MLQFQHRQADALVFAALAKRYGASGQPGRRQSPHNRHIFGRFQIYRFGKGAPLPLNHLDADLTIASQETFAKGERARPLKTKIATWRL